MCVTYLATAPARQGHESRDAERTEGRQQEVETKRRGPGKAASFLLAVAASVLVFAWWSGVASAANGTLEICKVGSNGTDVGGSTFSFSAQKGQNGTPLTITVTPPQCSHDVVPAGKYTITENLSSGGLEYQQTGASTIPVGALLNENAAAAKTKVNVPAGGDTHVTIANQLAGTVVKVCKTSTDFTTPPPGPSYSFTIGGTNVSATANGGCSTAVKVQALSVILVTESVPPGDQVTTVTADNGTIKKQGIGTCVNPASSGVYTSCSVRFVVGNGANELTFDDEAVGPSQTGSLEICKDAGDQFITGSYDYTIQDGNQTFTATVPVGQCTAAINGRNGGIPAGTVTVTETIPANQKLSDVFLGQFSAGQLGTVIPDNGSAVVVVPISSAGDVQVHFVNSTNVTQLKVCKLLPAGSEALQGTKFTFTVSDDAYPAGTTWTVNITVPKGANSGCKIVTDPKTGQIVPFPVGSHASATEANSNPFIDAGSGLGNPGTATTKIVNGINELDVTNTAFGRLEMCKYLVRGDPDYGDTFTFDYSSPASQNTSGKAVSGTVKAVSGGCTFPADVPVGTYTVTEDLSGMTVTLANGQKVPEYQFYASDARTNDGVSQCVPKATGPVPTPTHPPASLGCGNPLTVTVPYAGDPLVGETQVSIWNTINRVSLKICKAIDPNSSAAIQGLTYTYTATITVNGVPTVQSFTASPPYPSCAMPAPFGNFPIANADGSPITITVTEDPFPGHVSNIAVLQGAVVSSDDVGQTVTLNPSGGTAQVTFTNASGQNLLCFSGSEDSADGSNPGAGGTCTLSADGQSATLDTTVDVCPNTVNTNCYAGVYYAFPPNAGELLSATANLHFDYSPVAGNVAGGSPRFSLAVDTNGDGTLDEYLFADAPGCDPLGTGTVDVHNPLCVVFVPSDGLSETWATINTNHPGWKFATNAVSFVVADQSFNGTISNVAIGP